MFRALYESGAIKDEEFHGAGLNEARREVISQFKTFHTDALALAKTYDECIKPLEEIAPHFALASTSLVRMWCVAHFSKNWF